MSCDFFFVEMCVEVLASQACDMCGILVRIVAVAAGGMLVAGQVGILGVLVEPPTARCETLGMPVERPEILTATAAVAVDPAPDSGSADSEVDISERVCRASRSVTTL